MATIRLEDQSDLDIKAVINALESRFSGGYEVYPTRLPFRDFVVKANEWTAVGVGLRRHGARTEFVYTAFIPSVVRRFLPACGLAIGIIGAFFGYFLVRLALKPSWQALEDEVGIAIREECSEAALQKGRVPPAMPESTAEPDEAWAWTRQLAILAFLFSLLTTFIAQNFILVEVRLLFASLTMRLAWSLLLAAVIGFLAGAGADQLWRRRPH